MTTALGAVNYKTCTKCRDPALLRAAADYLEKWN